MPTLHDPEMEFRHKETESRRGKGAMRRLIFISVKHVDDIKVLGERSFVEKLVSTLESHFGELTITEGVFTNCGMRHERHESHGDGVLHPGNMDPPRSRHMLRLTGGLGAP